ncbi:hypothetical protein CRENBAI_011297 [Crenichthys baileyi]|uniref:Uncharacterized protein n=1 Tax=Crenichthys baileyi TaxID=28760 RepID=A0AAV9QTB4_9TELE
MPVVPDIEHTRHKPTRGHRATLMNSVSNGVERVIHASGLLEVTAGPADGLRTSDAPAQLCWSNFLSPGIFSMLLRLCWETQQTFGECHKFMCHSGGVGLPEQPLPADAHGVREKPWQRRGLPVWKEDSRDRSTVVTVMNSWLADRMNRFARHSARSYRG